MIIRSLIVLAALAACQGGSASPSKEPARGSSGPRGAIELRDEKGRISATVVAGRPCRATIDGVELVVGTSPLVAMVGDIRWEGIDANGSTVITRDGVPDARIYPAIASPAEAALFDHEGIAIVRVGMRDQMAELTDRKGSLVATASRTPTGIAIGDRMVTGTTDVMLAALLATTSAGPELRGLAACHRLRPAEKAAF